MKRYTVLLAVLAVAAMQPVPAFLTSRMYDPGASAFSAIVSAQLPKFAHRGSVTAFGALPHMHLGFFLLGGQSAQEQLVRTKCLHPLLLKASLRTGTVASSQAVSGEDAAEMDIRAAIDGEFARLNALLDAGGAESELLKKAFSQIENGNAASGKTAKVGTLQKAIKKKSGAFSTLMELCIEEGSKQDVDDVSRACRMGKVVCVYVQYLSPPAFNPHSVLCMHTQAAAIVVDVGFALDGLGRATMLQVP
jgi:hypothetical protein